MPPKNPRVPDDDDPDNGDAPVKKKVEMKKPKRKLAEDDEEDDGPVPPKKKVPIKEDDEDDSPPMQSKKKVQKDDEDDSVPVPPKKKIPKDDEDDDPKPLKKKAPEKNEETPVKKKPSPKEEEEEEAEPVKKKKTLPPNDKEDAEPVKKKVTQDSDDDHSKKEPSRKTAAPVKKPDAEFGVAALLPGKKLDTKPKTKDASDDEKPSAPKRKPTVDEEEDGTSKKKVSKKQKTPPPPPPVVETPTIKTPVMTALPSLIPPPPPSVFDTLPRLETKGFAIGVTDEPLVASPRFTPLTHLSPHQHHQPMQQQQQQQSQPLPPQPDYSRVFPRLSGAAAFSPRPQSHQPPHMQPRTTFPKLSQNGIKTQPSGGGGGGGCGTAATSPSGPAFGVALPVFAPNTSMTLEKLQVQRKSKVTDADAPTDILDSIRLLIEIHGGSLSSSVPSECTITYTMPVPFSRQHLPPPKNSSLPNQTDFYQRLISLKANGVFASLHLFVGPTGSVTFRALTRSNTEYQHVNMMKVAQALQNKLVSNPTLCALFQGHFVFSAECMQPNERDVVFLVFDIVHAVDQNLSQLSFFKRWSFMVSVIAELHRILGPCEVDGKVIHLLWKPFHAMEHLPILFGRFRITGTRSRAFVVDADADHQSYPEKYRASSILAYPGGEVDSDGVVMQQINAASRSDPMNQIIKYRWEQPTDLVIQGVDQKPVFHHKLYFDQEHKGEMIRVLFGRGQCVDESVVERIAQFARTTSSLVVECLPDPLRGTFQIIGVRDPNDKTNSNKELTISTTMIGWTAPVTEQELLNSKFASL